MKNNGKLILTGMVLGVFVLAFILLVLTRNKPAETPPAAQSIPQPSISAPAAAGNPVSPVTALLPRTVATPTPPVLSNTPPPALAGAGSVAVISNLATQRNMFTLEYGHSKTNKHRRSVAE